MGDEKKTSKVMMTMVHSTGTWLNNCPQPQHYYISLKVLDPERKEVVKIGLSFEQVSRMLMYNGEIDCTLIHYRGTDGKLKTEEVEIPKTVHQRMKDRMTETHESLKNRMNDLEKDIYEMVNGGSKSKKKLEELLQEMKVIREHFESNENFVVQQAEEEIADIQSNALNQLGVFIESRTGLEAPRDILKQLIPTGAPLALPEPVKPVKDNYKKKKREPKRIIEMTAMEVSDLICKYLRYFESLQGRKNSKEKAELFSPSAHHTSKGVHIRYKNYTSATLVSLPDAKRYLKFLTTTTDLKDFKRHWQALEE